MSKAIINGKLYDTEKAEKLFSFRRRVDMGPIPGTELRHAPFHLFTFYKTKKGNYFEHDENKDAIDTPSEAYVQQVIRRLDPDRYIELFGEVEEA